MGETEVKTTFPQPCGGLTAWRWSLNSDLPNPAARSLFSQSIRNGESYFSLRLG